MNRRAYLASFAAGTAALSGCTALGKPQEDSQPAYYGQKNIVYEHDDLCLRLQQETIHLGDTIDVQITNIGDSHVALGCHKPWAIQKYSDGEWRHVTWTGDGYYDMCAERLAPGSTYREEITLSKSELENQADTVDDPLTPGRYRFMLIGITPYVAIDFDVLDFE